MSTTTNERKEENGALSSSLLQDFETDFSSNDRNALAMHVVCNHPLNAVAVKRDNAVDASRFQYSVKVPKEAKITNQKASGRCWLFAACNVIRLKLMKEYNLETFEFSQSYLFFWDKLEKANFFLETILGTADLATEDRLIAHLLTAPVNDGGQWSMFAAVWQKYGLVPKDAMPETATSGASRPLNWLITNRLRTCARDLRTAKKAGATDEALQATKKECMNEIYRILVVHLGRPPVTFDWSFRDKDKKFTRMAGLTPITFARDVVKFDPNDYVSLVNDPRHEYEQSITVDYLGNVVGGTPVLYVNKPAQFLKDITVKVLKSGEPVWFGCDVGKFLDRKKGIMDTNLFAYDMLLGSKFTLDKADRLRYGESLMTHAMVFTGVDLDDEEKASWFRVENSWGTDNGDGGFFCQSSDWFHEYTYQIVVHKSNLDADTLKVLEQQPIHLPAWDPMGSLA